MPAGVGKLGENVSMDLKQAQNLMTMHKNLIYEHKTVLFAGHMDVRWARRLCNDIVLRGRFK